MGEQASQNLIPVVLELGDFHLNGVCSRSLQKAQQFANRYGVDFATDDWTKLINPDIVDAIVIAATPELHANAVSTSLEKGVHIFVEKPPAPDTATLKILIEKANKKPQTVTFVDFNFRYGETYQKTAEIVRNEGEIQCVRIRFISSKPRNPIWGWTSLPRSLLFAVGIHAIDMAFDLLGPISQVSAKICWISTEKFALDLALQNKNGKTAFIELGNYSNRFEYSLELIGLSGIVAHIKQHNEVSIYNSKKFSNVPKSLEGKQTIEYLWPTLHGGYAVTGYKGALSSFHESIVSDKSATAPISSCLSTYEIMDKILSLL